MGPRILEELSPVKSGLFFFRYSHLKEDAVAKQILEHFQGKAAILLGFPSSNDCLVSWLNFGGMLQPHQLRKIRDNVRVLIHLRNIKTISCLNSSDQGGVYSSDVTQLMHVATSSAMGVVENADKHIEHIL